MDVTEIDHGYLVRLQAEFPDIFRVARENNWIVCVPKREALLGVTVDKQFVESHMLRPSPTLKGVFVSADPSSFSCAIDDEWSWLEVYPDCDCDGSDEPSPPDKIKIVGKEYLLFPDLKPLTFLVLDACICVKSSHSRRTPEPENCVVEFDPHLFDELPQDVHSIRQADRFFGDVLGSVVYDMIEDSVERFMKTYTITRDSLECVSAAIKRDLIDVNVQKILRVVHCIREDLRNPGFVRCVNMAVECLVMSRMHDEVFPVICEKFRVEDQLLTERATEFCKLRITADQLGAKIEFTVPLPAAVVELASLDSFKTPLEKIQAMRNSVDLVIAEVKTALAHALSADGEFTTPKITADDLLPLMTVVLMKAKPLHLASNAFYTIHFCWSAHNFSYALATVQAAKDFLQTVRPSKLRRSQTKLVQELSLAELMLVTGEVDARKSSDGKEIPDVVYENQMERVTAQIEASTRQLSQEQIRSPQLSRSCTPSGNSTPGSPFLSPFLSRSPRVRFRIGDTDTGA